MSYCIQSPKQNPTFIITIISFLLFGSFSVTIGLLAMLSLFHGNTDILFISVCVFFVRFNTDLQFCSLSYDMDCFIYFLTEYSSLLSVKFSHSQHLVLIDMVPCENGNHPSHFIIDVSP